LTTVGHCAHNSCTAHGRPADPTRCDSYAHSILWTMAHDIRIDRAAIAHRGKQLEYFTIIWNSLEAAIAITAGAVAGSISLVGFGIDSLIEVTSGATLLWRMATDSNERGRDTMERRSL